MTEQDYLNAAIDERNICAAELLRMSQHLMKLDEVVAIHRHRVWKQKLVVKFWMDEDEELQNYRGMLQHLKEYNLVTETRGIHTHIAALAMFYYDAKGEVQVLAKGAISGSNEAAEELYVDLGDLIATFKRQQLAKRAQEASAPANTRDS